MRQIPKTELSPDNGAVIDTKWKVGPLATMPAPREPSMERPGDMVRLPELIVYDHIGFKGA